ncbi:MAG: carotenoid oxygenase family protein [Microthrixaceae bacterium]
MLPLSLLTDGPHHLDLEVVSGAVPEGLSGEVVVSSPAPGESGRPALFGLGTLSRLSLTPGTHGAPSDRYAWRSRVLDTPARRLLEGAPEQFLHGPTGPVSPVLGFPNLVNTAPVPWGDRLFATWDVGRPVEVDRATFDVLGEVGSAASWGPPTLELGGVMPFYYSSAHPVIDPERSCMWTVKLTPNPDFTMQLTVIRWDGDGHEVKRWPLPDTLVGGSSHNISQTRDYLVLADSGNFKADPAEVMGGERTITIDSEVNLYLVRKDALEATPQGQPVAYERFPLAPTAGHFSACWDDSEGVRVVFEHQDLMDLGWSLRADDTDALDRPVRPELVGMYHMAMAPSSLSEVCFLPGTGRCTPSARVRHDWSWNLQLSALDWSLEGLTEPTLHHVVVQGWRPDAVAQRVLAHYRDRLAADPLGAQPSEPTPGALVSFRRPGLEVAGRWEFPATTDWLTSPAFVPRQPGPNAADAPGRTRHAGAEPGGHDGWVVLPVLSDERFRVEIFDAAAVGNGPVATLAAPRGATVPLQLHSAWMPPAASSGIDRDREHLDWVGDLNADAVAALEPRLRRLVHSAGQLGQH